MANMLKVCAYARVSTKSKKQDSSLQSQIIYYNNLFDSTPNYINMGVYAERESGGRERNRSAFKQMINECRNRNIDIIYTKTIARFGRNQLQLLRTLNELTQIGVRVIFELEGIDSIKDKKIIQTVLKSYLAEEELEKDRLATNFGIQRMFEKGKVVLSRKKPLFGYTYDKNKNLVIEEKESLVVKEIFERYCNNERPSCIASLLNIRGIKTSSNRDWNRDDVLRIIKQEKYSGMAFLQKSYNKDGKKVKNNGEKAIYIVENFCLPIITIEQFEKANEIRVQRAKFKKNHNYTPEKDCFKGKIRCGLCGGNYIKVTSGHRIYASGNREKISYQCYKTHKSAMKECRNKVQKRETLEMGFVVAFNKLKDYFLNEKMIIYKNEELLLLEKRIEDLLSSEKRFLKIEAQGCMTQALSKDYDNLIEEVLSLQKRANEIKKYNNEIILQNSNLSFFKDKSERVNELKKFDEKVFLDEIDHIDVFGKNRMMYIFKNGFTVEEEIIDYYSKNDEIGEVKIYV